ncbi:hypothetical protein [Chromohalobacter japonicus]|uniref:hypothetical protein n=1 Tax=Chromohalobacter japonicus TaxID=223900 RepID=UPI001178368C|nr:hypothetical protein [Chromohalobacter japonicus]
MRTKQQRKLENTLLKDKPLELRGMARKIAMSQGISIEEALPLAEEEYKKRMASDRELEQRKSAYHAEKMRQLLNPDKPRGKESFGGIVQGGSPGGGKRR